MYWFSLVFQEINGFTGFDLKSSPERVYRRRGADLYREGVKSVRVEPGGSSRVQHGWPGDGELDLRGGEYRIVYRGEDDLGNPIRMDRRVRLLAKDHVDCMQ